LLASRNQNTRGVSDELVRSTELLAPNSSASPRLALEAACPGEKAQQLPARGPDKAHNAFRGQSFRTHAGVGLYAPTQIIASPWSQPMAASRIPDKTERSQQGVSFSIEYRRPGRQSVRMERGEEEKWWRPRLHVDRQSGWGRRKRRRFRVEQARGIRSC
jgi:hypothetical protein